jgi:hypothetical protein
MRDYQHCEIEKGRSVDFSSNSPAEYKTTFGPSHLESCIGSYWQSFIVHVIPQFESAKVRSGVSIKAENEVDSHQVTQTVLGKSSAQIVNRHLFRYS